MRTLREALERLLGRWVGPALSKAAVEAITWQRWSGAEPRRRSRDWPSSGPPQPKRTPDRAGAPRSLW